MSRLSLAVFLASVAVSCFVAGAQSIATNSPDGEPLSERVVAYTIDAKLDTQNKTLDATETLAYRNLTRQALDSFPFHLYLNAFRPQSTFSYETHRDGGIRAVEESYPPEKIGAIEIKTITADGYGNLAPGMKFIAPDDDNPDDHTVMMVHLPHAAEPGQTITFHLTFHDKFPESIARNGYKRDFIMGGQWFPKVGVWWHNAWNCHQYHATTEFFADFGTFDVRLNVPQRYIVGATGVQTAEQLQSDKTKTLSFHAEDVHDFAFAASPHFLIADEIFQSSMGPVKMHALVLECHANQRQRYLNVLKASMQKFDDWYGPYPYKQITLVDPEPDSELGGMEYPTLFTAGTTWAMPAHLYLPELVTEHEYGHQYWYGMVATNEFEEAWLDEGINSYTEVKVLSALYGERTSLMNFPFVHAGDVEQQRAEYVSMPDYDPVTREAWKFVNSNSYGAVTYGKTASALMTLESIVGEDTMRQIMRTYFTHYRFKHPTGTDFINTAIGVSGRDELDEFFDKAIYGTAILNYAVDNAYSEPVEWWKPDRDAKQFRTIVQLHRKGDFIRPVTVEIRFDDGEKVRESWDGSDRWTRFTYIKTARVVSAEIDPDHQIWLDTNLLNNSFTVSRDRRATHKLANWWMFTSQLVAQWAAWIV
jgi:hypothetical protein